MSLQLEDERESTPHSELSYDSEKKGRVTYPRDFLLSLSELDVCKRLPSGFDQSILSGLLPQDRYRVPGSFSSQSYRHNEYGSSPPTRGDIGGFSRSNQGRWDSRSSGRSDRDSDSQSDRDSDSGRRYANQTRKPWQSSEHDGLLGSGSFPRPSGYSSSSAPKFRPNQHYQLNRSNEPYHPPRPYKAVPHSRRDTDSFNDETFGSSEYTDEDRAEEERKRRASFELMRKEQQKAFQERQKSNPGKLKDEFDICELLEDPKEDKRLPTGTNESVKSFAQPASNDDSNKSSIPPPASRPLVPPGFSGTLVEKNVGKKLSSEVGNELEDRPLLVKGGPVVNGAPNSQEQQQHFGRNDGSKEQLTFPIDLPVTNKSERIAPMDISDKTSSMDSHVQKIPKLVEAIEASGNNKDIAALDPRDGVGDKLMDLSGRTQSTSILDKLFSKALSLNGSDASSLVEEHDVKAEDTFSPRIPQTGQSSKFAQWFLEEEKKPNEGVSSAEPNDLLSLIVGGEIGRPRVGDESPYQSSELSEKQMTMNLKSSIVEDSGELPKNDKSEAVPAVLTCEDLEQSILSGLDENSTALRPVDKCGASEQSITNVDDNASKHLLSLLKNGEGLNYVAPSMNFPGILLDKQLSNGNATSPVQTTRTQDTVSASNSGKPLTLETLFGSAFMKELQSVGATPSVQRGFVGPASADALNSHGLPFPIRDETLLSSAVDTSSSIKDHEPNMLSHDTTRNEVVSKLGGFDMSAGVPLPEENTSIGTSGSLEHQHFIPATQEMTADISEELAALNSVFRDRRLPVEGQEGAPVHHGPYDTWYPDIQGQNLHIQSSSSQLQVNHVASLFHPMDSHPSNVNPHMNVVAPENHLRHDISNHQVFPNMLRAPLNHPSGGATGYDHTMRSPMYQQMHMPGNYPPTHMLHGFPRGAQPPVPPPHANNSMMGYGQDPNPIQGFPYGQSRSNTGSLRYQQGADLGVRTNNPEALQRLIGMELRLNPKQGHPLPATAQNQGNFGPELGMGFGYR